MNIEDVPAGIAGLEYALKDAQMDIDRLTTEVKKAADLLREGSKRFGEYGDTYMQAGMLALADEIADQVGLKT